jgi:tellurite resistance protein
MPVGPLRSAWSVVRRVEELFEFQTQTREALQIINDRLKAVDDRLLWLEWEQSQVITAAGAAPTVAGNVISDAVTRITRIEGRADQLERNLLPPPG